jgi:hypothetical protein
MGLELRMSMLRSPNRAADTPVYVARVVRCGWPDGGMRRFARLFTVAVAVAAIATLPAAASAHVGVGATYGFVHRRSHPLGGIDHLLTMVAGASSPLIWAAGALWNGSFGLVVAQ